MWVPDTTAAVAAFFTSLANRELTDARQLWSADGVWHVQGHHDLAGDYSRDEYIAMLGRWFEAHPDYAAEDFRIEPFGEDVVVTHLVTVNGRFDGRASGLMIFRVGDSQILEGWAIPTFEGGAHPF